MIRSIVAILTPALAAGLLSVGCDGRANADDVRLAASKQKGGEKGKGDGRGKPKFKLGRITHKAIAESSGLAASRKHARVYWTHNDSGNGPYVFAITRDGKLVAEYPIARARNTDWEAISIDNEGRLYIADIGNNDLKRDRAVIYRVDEPDPAAVSEKGKGNALRVNGVWRLKYPGRPFDAESFFVWGGKGYVISKLLSGSNAGLYRFDLAATGSDAVALEHVCELPIRSPVSDAAISADGARLAVLTVTGPNLFTIDGDPANAGKVTPAYVNYFDPRDLNMEGVCFTDGGLLASTEQGQMLFFADELFNSQIEKKD